MTMIVTWLTRAKRLDDWVFRPVPSIAPGALREAERVRRLRWFVPLFAAGAALHWVGLYLGAPDWLLPPAAILTGGTLLLLAMLLRARRRLSDLR
jgi:fatty acid desaturase